MKIRIATFITLIGTAAISGQAQRPSIKNDPARTKVVLLGTGTPVPDPDRSGPATLIVVDDRAYLIDFGPGVVRRAEAALSERFPRRTPAISM